MAGENIIEINSIEALEEYAETIFKNIDYAFENKIKVDKDVFRPIVFRIPSSEDEPFINGEWMSVFLKIQENIINSMEIGLNRPLEEAEKAKLQTKVYVKKGSNIYEFLSGLASFFERDILEVIPEMTVGQIMAIVTPITLAYVGVRYLTTKSKEKIALNKDNLDHQKEIKRLELEETNSQLLAKGLTDSEEERLLKEKDRHEASVKVIDLLGKILDNESKGESKIARSLSKIDCANNLEINGATVSQEELKELAKKEKKEKSPFTTVNDYFFVKTVNFDNNETKIKLINDKYNFKSFAIPKDRFEPEDLEKINNREPLHLKFTTRKNDDGSYDVPTLMEIVRDENK